VFACLILESLVSSQSLLDDSVYFTELTEGAEYMMKNKILLDDAAEASSLSHMPKQWFLVRADCFAEHHK
jgi:hypothetical protein